LGEQNKLKICLNSAAYWRCTTRAALCGLNASAVPPRAFPVLPMKKVKTCQNVPLCFQNNATLTISAADGSEVQA